MPPGQGSSGNPLTRTLANSVAPAVLYKRRSVTDPGRHTSLDASLFWKFGGSILSDLASFFSNSALRFASPDSLRDRTPRGSDWHNVFFPGQRGRNRTTRVPVRRRAGRVSHRAFMIGVLDCSDWNGDVREYSARASAEIERLRIRPTHDAASTTRRVRYIGSAKRRAWGLVLTSHRFGYLKIHRGRGQEDLAGHQRDGGVRARERLGPADDSDRSQPSHHMRMQCLS
jgi:hypothetical protein